MDWVQHTSVSTWIDHHACKCFFAAAHFNIFISIQSDLKCTSRHLYLWVFLKKFTIQRFSSFIKDKHVAFIKVSAAHCNCSDSVNILKISWILFLSETLSLAGLEVIVEAVLHADRRISRELLLFEN